MNSVDLEGDPKETMDRSESDPETRRDLESRLAAWYRAQIAYYEDRTRHATEYPPLAEVGEGHLVACHNRQDVRRVLGAITS